MRTITGFTLVELMITLVIAGFVLLIGMPSFAKYRSSLLLRQANAQLMQDVRRARQLAVTRRAPVFIRFGAPPITANITSYLIHVDTNGDGIAQSTELRLNRSLPTGTKLDAVSLAPTDSLAFDISGILRPGTQGGMLAFSNNRNRRDTLIVSAAGICYRP